MLRGEIVEQIDQVATSVELVANRGIRKGEPDRAGVIQALVALVLEDARLLERLRLRVAPQVQEIREREQAKAERRQRSGGRVGRPPEIQLFDEDGRRINRPVKRSGKPQQVIHTQSQVPELHPRSRGGKT